MLKLFFTSLIFFSISTPLLAYLGPGIGGGVLMATIGIIIAILAAAFGLVWFPVKRLIKKRKEKKDKEKIKVD